jgi:hypothetical protein
VNVRYPTYRLTTARQISASFSCIPTEPAASLPRSLMRHWFGGEENGTRNFAVAAGCADPDHHPVVVVLRPLSNKTEVALHRASPSGGVRFVFRAAVSLMFEFPL